jgi:hypothetical protein
MNRHEDPNPLPGQSVWHLAGKPVMRNVTFELPDIQFTIIVVFQLRLSTSIFEAMSLNKTGKVNYLEHTGVPKVFLTPYHAGRCIANAIRCHCCVFGHSCTATPGHRSATVCSNKGPFGPTALTTRHTGKHGHGRAHMVLFPHATARHVTKHESIIQFQWMCLTQEEKW